VGGRTVTGLDRGEQAAYRHTIGFIFHLLPALTVLDNVAGPVFHGGRASTSSHGARELVTSIDLAGREAALHPELSGGQQQRVAIRALINEPGLLLASEPNGNLDTTTTSTLAATASRSRHRK
jgi:putative ABC transport system ATP-binding protein